MNFQLKLSYLNRIPHVWEFRYSYWFCIGFKLVTQIHCSAQQKVACFKSDLCGFHTSQTIDNRLFCLQNFYEISCECTLTVNCSMCGFKRVICTTLVTLYGFDLLKKNWLIRVIRLGIRFYSSVLATLLCQHYQQNAYVKIRTGSEKHTYDNLCGNDHSTLLLIIKF